MTGSASFKSPETISVDEPSVMPSDTSRLCGFLSAPSTHTMAGRGAPCAGALKWILSFGSHFWPGARGKETESLSRTVADVAFAPDGDGGAGSAAGGAVVFGGVYRSAALGTFRTLSRLSTTTLMLAVIPGFNFKSRFSILRITL